MRRALPPVLLLAVAGCGGDDGERRQPAAPQRAAIEGTVDLERAAAGPPDAGTRGGHGGDQLTAAVSGPSFAFRGRVRPPDSELTIRSVPPGRPATVSADESGRFLAEVRRLRRGPNAFRLEATKPGHLPWSVDVRIVRRAAGSDRVAVPERDPTPPEALLRFRHAGGVVVRRSPVRPWRRPPVAVGGRTLRLTAVVRDAEGTGRVRVSVFYRAPCAGGAVTRDFPPAQVERVRVAPGVRVPARRSRTVRLRLPRCAVRGKAWADATNAHGLESFSTPIRFVRPPR
ncbi:MAG TPA: hypothetical protein VHF89_14820 [Solirubrobacteraceae bacterium]|nr:hypothetical protein [Solirubrobacteraceae bacterium]